MRVLKAPWIVLFALVSLSILGLLAACGAQRSALIQAPTIETGLLAETSPLPVDPEVAIGALPNGLTYYVRENRKPEQRASLFLVVAAGSVDEDDDQQGLAHMAEHMAFNGTEHFPKHALIDYLESIGMAFGPEINAFTGFDQTVYMLQVPTDDGELLDSGLQILENWAHRVSFEDEEIDLERGVIVEEWRVGLGAHRRIRDRQLPVVYHGSKYAERSVIGRMDIIENHEYDTIRRYYRDWYRPSLQAVIAVGDFDQQEMIAKIHEVFAELKDPTRPRPHARPHVPDHAETLISVVTDPEATRTEASLLWKSKPREVATLGDLRRQLALNLGMDMLRVRFQELSREVDPPFTMAMANERQMTRTVSGFSLTAVAPEGGSGRALERLVAEAERVRRHGFTDGELERAGQRFLRGLQRQVEEKETTESRSWTSKYMRHFLNGGVLLSVEDQLRLSEQFLPLIDVAEVEAALLELMTDHNQVITVSGPDREDLVYPTERQISAIIASAVQQPIAPYIDETVDAPLVAKLPSPVAITSREYDPVLQTTFWTLANGVRVVIKPTTFKNDEVLMRSYQWGGTSVIDDPEQRRLAATILSGVVQGGVGAFDQNALQKALTGKAVSCAPSASAVGFGWQGSASPQDLETLLQLVWLQATSPREDAEAFSSWRQRTRVWYENRGVEPMNALRDSVQVLLHDRARERRPFTVEDIDRSDLADGLAFYRQMTADLGGMVFFFVGNLTPEQLEPLARAYLGNLPAAAGEHRWHDRHVPRARGLRTSIIRQGLDPKGYVQMVLTGETDWSPEAVYAMESLVASLRIRLREVVREELSGTYGVRVSGSLQRIPRAMFRVDIGWGCHPERVVELTMAVRDVIDEMVEQGPNEETIEKVREIQLRSEETSLQENRTWLNELVNSHQAGLDPHRILTKADRITALSVDLAREAAVRYLTAGNEVRVVLLPEELPAP